MFGKGLKPQIKIRIIYEIGTQEITHRRQHTAHYIYCKKYIHLNDIY